MLMCGNVDNAASLNVWYCDDMAVSANRVIVVFASNILFIPIQAKFCNDQSLYSVNMKGLPISLKDE